MPKSVRWALLGIAAVVAIVVAATFMVNGGSSTTTGASDVSLGADGALGSAQPAAVSRPSGTADPTATTKAAKPTTSTKPATTKPTTTSKPTTTKPTTATSRGTSGLKVVALSALPAEATDTWELIVRNGPFPYDRDGVVFENREKILPAKAQGYYHEYTVITPGEGDRGARRLIVGGQRQAVFYTGDHYDSFVEVDTSR